MTAPAIAASLLALDAGQTGIKAMLTTATGDRRHYRFAGIRTNMTLLGQLADVVLTVATQAGGAIHTIAAGVSGLTAAEMRPADLATATAACGVRRVLLAHDAVTAYLGALGDEPGVVVAAGTGVVTLAVGAQAVARVDGWGYLIGDAGSGFWIGRAALDAVLREHDGRGPATALTGPVTRDFPRIEDAYIELQRDPGLVGRIAGYASLVAELAPSDEVAAGICAAAATELAHSAEAALERVDEAQRPDPLVCGLGGIFDAPAVATGFELHLRNRWPELRVRPAVSNALDGVAALGGLTPTHPLHQLVSAAG